MSGFFLIGGKLILGLFLPAVLNIKGKIVLVTDNHTMRQGGRRENKGGGVKLFGIVKMAEKHLFVFKTVVSGRKIQISRE